MKNKWSLQEKLYNDFLNLCDEETHVLLCKEWAFNIEYIDNPTTKVKLAAIETDGFSICYMKNPNNDLKVAAVKQSACVIQDLKNPSEEIQLIAIDNILITEEWSFFKYCLHKITSSIALNKLYQKTASNEYKIMIKNSTYWKDDASLILEVIDG